MVSDKVLVHFNQDLPIVLKTDASNDGISGCLSHIMANGSERPITFISRTLMPAEKRYSEALAVYWSVRKLYYYIKINYTIILKLYY